MENYEHIPHTLRENMNIYSAGLMGTVLPIVAAKVVIDTFNPNDNLSGEALNWIGAIAINLVPIVEFRFPVPFCTGYLGTLAGKYQANKLRANRVKQKNNLENTL